MARKNSIRRRSRPTPSTPQLSERIQDQIETERRRLNKAVAILVGAELTAEYCPESSLVTDAVGVARDLVEAVIEALDVVALRRGTPDA